MRGGLGLRIDLSLSPVRGGGPPVNTVLPAISGTTNQGQTLSTTNGTWTNSPTIFTYQWNRNGASIGGATASTYLLVAADVATTITVTVTASNGSPTEATSAGTAAISPPVSIAFTNTLNTTVALQADGSYNVTKTSVDAWDGSAATAASFTGDYMMIVKTTTVTTKNFVFGGSLVPAGTSNNTGFFRAMSFNAAATVFGVNADAIASSAAYAVNEYWFIKRVAGVHTTSKGSTDDPAASTTVALGLTNSASTVGAKLSIFHNTTMFNVRAYAL